MPHDLNIDTLIRGARCGGKGEGGGGVGGMGRPKSKHRAPRDWTRRIMSDDNPPPMPRPWGSRGGRTNESERGKNKPRVGLLCARGISPPPFFSVVFAAATLDARSSLGLNPPPGGASIENVMNPGSELGTFGIFFQ